MQYDDLQIPSVANKYRYRVDGKSLLVARRLQELYRGFSWAVQRRGLHPALESHDSKGMV
jgi:hypothetical protein